MRTSFIALGLFLILGNTASAQGLFSASAGSVFGGNITSSKTLAVSIGGMGTHNIGSELEFSRTNLPKGKMYTLMPGIYIAKPFGNISPYGIFGFGFIIQRNKSSKGSIFQYLSDDQVGYSAGGGIKFKFSKHAGLKAEMRHFKVRTSRGVSFQRLTVGIVLG